MKDHAVWLGDLLVNLEQTGPQGAAAVGFLRKHRVGLSLHDQSAGARWVPRLAQGRLLGWGIQLHPRYADGAADAPYPLSLVVHETRHLEQGFFTALSVYGELDAWKTQFAFLRLFTGRYHESSSQNDVIAELMSLPLGPDRAILRRSRQLMQIYAGKAYRIDLLPLFPLPEEIAFLLFRKQPAGIQKS